MQIDGTDIDTDNYKIYGDDSSTSVELFDNYLNALNPDTYTFTLVFSDGVTVSTDVRVCTYSYTSLQVFYYSTETYTDDTTGESEEMKVIIDGKLRQETFVDGELWSEVGTVASYDYDTGIATLTLLTADEFAEVMAEFGDDWEETFPNAASANSFEIYVKDELVGTYEFGETVEIDLSKYYEVEGKDGRNEFNIEIYAVTVNESGDSTVIVSDSPKTDDNFNAAPFLMAAIVSIYTVIIIICINSYCKKKLAAKNSSSD